jgi:predicted RNase H-like HicB family nuclease
MPTLIRSVVRCEDDLWYGSGLELPLVFAHGQSPEACVVQTRAALTAAVLLLLEAGRRPPAAATIGRRTEQVNLRLTAAEKLLLEATAKRKGFTGLSDFLRAAAIEAATK